MQHVYLEVGDPIGSTDIVIDKETSELVERRTEQAFGAQETDYRPSRWDSFRENYRLTGKEDAMAFGLVYFGARYYAPALARWISPDPLAIHGAVGDLNPYAYVGNSPLNHVDPWGLEDDNGSGPVLAVAGMGDGGSPPGGQPPVQQGQQTQPRVGGEPAYGNLGPRAAPPPLPTVVQSAQSAVAETEKSRWAFVVGAKDAAIGFVQAFIAPVGSVEKE